MYPVCAHPVEEFGGRVAAADEVVEQPHLDAPGRGANQRIGDLPADGVVAENVHLQRDARLGRVDRGQPGRERLRAVAQKADGVAAEQLARIFHVARRHGRARRGQGAGAREIVSNFRTPGGIGWRRHC